MKTNIEKVTKYMEQSPLNQVFVIQAIDMYAKQVSDDKASLGQLRQRLGKIKFDKQ
jgi:uncharacterized membrane protein